MKTLVLAVVDGSPDDVRAELTAHLDSLKNGYYVYTGELTAAQEEAAVFELTQSRQLQEKLSEEVKLRRQSDRHQMVREQFVVFGQDRPEQPAVPSDDQVRFRARLITEEYVELLESLFCPFGVRGFDSVKFWDQLRFSLNGLVSYARINVDLAEALDACVDLQVVTEGLFVQFGFDSRPFWRLVHEANMAKASGPFRPDGKRLKPEGWQPPDIVGEIRRQGFVGLVSPC
jgi:predicted HAD superfamily Cof-like phosphohydrolase